VIPVNCVVSGGIGFIGYCRPPYREGHQTDFDDFVRARVEAGGLRVDDIARIQLPEDAIPSCGFERATVSSSNG
jgi:hypothetical protein